MTLPSFKSALPLCCALLLCSALSAQAQWQWLDKDGRKVFSDRAPPAEIPDKAILKRPGRAPAAAAGEAQGFETKAAPAPQLAASRPAPPTELELKRKQAADQEVAKRKAEEDRNAKALEASCDRAKLGLRTLQSGVRMARTNEKGEREVLDDTARNSEAARLQSVVDSDCKAG
ncbi:MAG: hypothetical protein RLZZ126_1863 [Pseudomonadota bacterium]|jgi:hypothetical protein